MEGILTGIFMTRLSSKTINYEQLAKVIDHSLLRPELTAGDVIDAGITRCDVTATAVILDDFKAQQEGWKVEAKPDVTPGAY
jgi:hypothetical protein